MIPILSKSAAQKLDTKCIETNYISEKQLMENAGQSIAEFVLEYVSHPFDKKILIVAGKGNNGGDGVIAHNYLLKYGVDSTLLLANGNIETLKKIDQYQIHPSTVIIDSSHLDFTQYSIAIDGLFGIGLSREVSGNNKELIQSINQVDFIVSIDIPSGINCDTGQECGVSVEADVTLTMGYPNLGHVLNIGKNNTGELFVLDIGFNKEFVDDSHTLITDSYIENTLNTVRFDDHKYSRGKLSLVCGSVGLTGASILASNASLRTGTGISKLIIPTSINSIIETSLIETITIPIESEFGFLDKADNSLISDALKWGDCLLLGPGLSTQPDAVNCTKDILENFDGNLVLDASGFQPLIENQMTISDLPEKTILTPHVGEFCKIFDLNKNDVLKNTIKHVKSLIKQLNGRVLVLKGNSTIIVSSKGSIHIVSNGNSLLATAGTGDVLSGMIASFVSQGYSLNQSAILGPYLHAEISNIYAENVSNHGLLASDMIDFIPTILGKYN